MDRSEAAIERVVRAALDEDLPWGDVTTDNLLSPALGGSGRIEARQSGVVAGLAVGQAVFTALDERVEFTPEVADGDRVECLQVIARLQGPLASMLRGERVALNFLQRLSGIATATRTYVDRIDGCRARIVDTRKTTPGLRLLEKYAVRAGGGQNHRYCLSDSVLIKDNHLAAIRHEGIDLKEGLARLRGRIPHTVTIEVEVETLAEVSAALEAGADAILLDNMAPVMMKAAVELVNGRALTEASGGITLETVRAIAETGVDLISVGALTHSVRAFDLSLEFES